MTARAVIVACVAAGVQLLLPPGIAQAATAGDLDTSFGGTPGQTMFGPGPGGQALGVALQADGKIVAAGSSGQGSSGAGADFAVARRNADSTPDGSFGVGGLVVTDFGPDDESANAVLVQPDGKIVAAGGSGHFGARNFALVRYNVDGTLDAGFGTGGKVTTDFAGNRDEANDLVLQPDGKIVVVGNAVNAANTETDFALARYNADGTLDTSFGGDGKVTTDPGSTDQLFSVALQPDGKIVAAGSAQGIFAVVRYNTDGTLDTSFDGDGTVATDIPVGSGPDVAWSVVVTSDAKIIAAGDTNNGADFALARYNSDGSLDTGFDGDGIVTTDFGGSESAQKVLVQPDGKIVAAGRGGGFVLARYNTDGSLDTSFDADGKAKASFHAGSSAGWDAVLQSDGKIVVAGSAHFSWGLARFTPDGGLDPTFVTRDGRVVTDFGADDVANAVVVQPDGKVVAAGGSGTNAARNFALVRYNVDGTLDAGFGTGGKVTTDFAASRDEANDLVLQPDGKIVVVGNAVNAANTSTEFALARYNADGSLDTSFGGDGKVTTNHGSTAQLFSVALQPDGKIVAAGSAQGIFATARYNTDGTLDTSFDGDGTVATDIPIGSGPDVAWSVAVTSDAKIIAAGDTNNGADFALARYNTDGSLDTGFDGDGIVTTDFGASESAQKVLVQPDGKIVAAGYGGGFVLARYNTDGSLDTTFDGDGKTKTTFAGPSAGWDAALQPDGRIVVAGNVTMGLTADFALLRYNADGSRDTSFGPAPDSLVSTDFASISGTLPGESGPDAALGVALTPDGKIVAVGGCNRFTSHGDFAVARYMATSATPPTFTSAATGDVFTGSPINITVTTTGAPVAALNVAAGSTLPPGVTFTDNGDGTGSLTGSTGAVGSHSFTLLATNGVAPDATQDFTLRVSNAPTYLSVNDVSVTEGNAGSTAATFTVTRTGNTSGTSSVSVATAAAGSAPAAAGTDYTTLAPTTLNFAAGETAKTVSVSVTGDTLGEVDETFVLNLSGVVGAILSDASGTATILNDDARTYLSVSNARVVEGNSGTKTVNVVITRSGNLTGSTGVNVATANAGSASATAGTDYTALAATRVNFAAGETVKTVPLTIAGDTAVEADETFAVNLSASTGTFVSDSSAVVTIANDDGATWLSVGDVALTEGNSGTKTASVTVTRTGNLTGTSTVTVATANGTAKATDFGARSTSFTFTAGQTTRVLAVNITGDTTVEANETFAVNLSAATGATISDSSAVATIVNDDGTSITPGPSTWVSVGDAWVTEGDSGTKTFSFTLTRSGDVSGSSSVTMATANGTATAGSDYTARSTTLTFTANQTTKTLVVSVTGDTTQEAHETLALNLSAATGATISDASATATIANDDASFISITDVVVTEGTQLAYTVNRSGSIGGTSSVNLATANGTAVGGSDFTARSLTLTFAPGETTKTVTVATTADTVWEVNETLNLNVSAAVGATISDTSGQGTIVNNDPVVYLSVDDVALFEGDSGTRSATFTITRSGNTTAAVSVRVATVNGTATVGSDYTALPVTTVAFAAGETTKTVVVDILGDATVEAAETVFLNLTAPVGAAISDSSGMATIVNDD